MKTKLFFAAALVLAGASPARAQTGLYTLNGGSASQSAQTYAATTADQSSIYVLNSGNLTLTSPTVTKTGNASSTDQSSQYGLNAAILVASAGNVAITSGSITTNASGANGLFATGTNSKITMTGGTIITSAEASHGVDVTYGGTIILNNVNVTTAGAGASAALSTDFGGGTVTVTGGTVKTAGLKSPAIYSTGTVTVTGATLTASGGPGGVIDGANSIVLNNTPVTGSNYGIYVHHTAPSNGTATANVTVTGGSLTATNGDAFGALSESGSQTVAITVKGGATVSASTGNLVNATSSSTVTLTADGETLTGNLVADSTSSVAVKLQNSTTFTGAAATNTAVTIDATSAWNVSAPSTLVTLSSAGKITVSSLSSPLTVSGTATLGGTLAVNLGSTTPAAGTYSLLTAGAVSGTFASLTFSPALGSAQTAKLNYTGTTVTLTITGSGASASGPSLTTLPTGCTIASGSTATLRVAASGSGLFYQWSKGGATIAGATNAILVLANAGAPNAGSYTVTVSNATGSTTSAPAVLAVTTTTNPGRIISLSTRAYVGTGSNLLIAGFAAGGAGTSGSAPMLIRGIGPQLAAFSVTAVLAAPLLTLYDGNSTQIDQNAGWNGSSTITAIDAAVGAFALTTATSKDAALYESALAKGSYTAQVSGSGSGSTTGIVLAEVYDARSSYSATSPHLVSISSRAFVGTDANVLIAGFTIGGDTAKTVLIRASGPALASFGLSGTLADPLVQLYNSNGAVLASNTGWSGNAQIAGIAASLGEFAWNSTTSADSALLVTLPPGTYTAQVSGASGDTGLALVEVYDVP